MFLLLLIFCIFISNAYAKVVRGAHGENELKCVECHGTENPIKAPDQDKCLECHGSYEEVSMLTKNLEEANPHDSHIGKINCTLCHKVHKASVLYCNESCHNFEMQPK